MKVLALEPYHGGSHRAFLEGWSQRSAHSWEVLGLPPNKWKWRMRHSAIHYAGEIRRLTDKGERWDALFCSDMLNLAEFVGLVPNELAGLPKVLYFHENQLTYPVRHEDERDYQFALTHLTSALAADAVWWNSRYHLETFLEAMDRFLRKMPDRQPFEAIEEIRTKSEVHPPGVEASPPRGPRKAGPMRILWAARWEHDKNPEDFFQAVDELVRRGIDFRLSVLGERFRESPDVFDRARENHRDRIDRWGWLDSREDYRTALLETDVFVSTANHEFFGIGAVEAILAGNLPLLPHRLSYPELLDLGASPDCARFFHDGSPENLADRLAELATRNPDEWREPAGTARVCVRRFEWDRLVGGMDDRISAIRTASTG